MGISIREIVLWTLMLITVLCFLDNLQLGLVGRKYNGFKHDNSTLLLSSSTAFSPYLNHVASSVDKLPKIPKGSLSSTNDATDEVTLLCCFWS